jgi:hypothetical protein
MSTWKRITVNSVPINTIVGVRGYIDNNPSKGYWYEMMQIDATGRFAKSGETEIWMGCTPVDFLELPYEPTPVEKFCDQFFPVIYEDVRSFARAEEKRNQAVQLVFNIFTALDGNKACSGVSMVYEGKELSRFVHVHWLRWIKKHHPEDLPG